MLWMTGMCPVKALSTEILWSVGQSEGKRGLEIQSDLLLCDSVSE